MRRKLFFFLERLQITRRERLAIGFLATLLVVLGSLNLAIEQKVIYDEKYYDELEYIFGERSRQAAAERDAILSRYQPGNEIPAKTVSKANKITALPDTVEHDSTTVQVEIDTLININTASSGQLQELPGIGPAYAERIIEWRNENGPFTSLVQLLEIRGIGERRLEGIKPLITFGETEDE